MDLAISMAIASRRGRTARSVGLPRRPRRRWMRESAVGQQGMDNVSQSVAIQVDGSGNTISVTYGGRPLLNLEMPHRRKREAANHPDALMRTINTYAATTTFVGRERMMGEFLAWLDAPARLSIRTLTGTAGAGKTRFALELMSRAKANATDDAGNLRPDTWAAGFVADPQPADPPDVKGLRFPNRVLAVVDYAAAMRNFLRPWLERLALNLADDSAAVRVLLLEREASA